jgi:hypothetical protein
MFWPTALFGLFAVLASAGAYLITAHSRGRRAGWGVALLAFVLFAALYAGLVALLRGGGVL